MDLFVGYIMSEASKLRRTIAAIELELGIKKAALRRAKAEEMVTCSHCELKTKVKHTTLLKFYSYISPHGCSGGDYWTSKCYATVCDKCQHVDHAYDDDPVINIKEFFNRHYDFITDHIEQFGEVLDVYLDNHIGWFHMHGETLQYVLDQAHQKNAARV